MDNAEAVRKVYEGWGQGDFSASLLVFDPDIVFVLHPGFPEAGTYRGLDAMREYMHGFLEPWTRITIEANEITPVGDCVVARVLQCGTGGASGAVTEFAYFHVWTFRGPKAIRLESVRRRAEAFAAAGAPPD